MRNRFGLLLAARRSHFVLKAPSTTLVPNLPFWLLSSNSSLQAVQKKSASGLLLGKAENLRVAAVRAIGPSAHPSFRPSARALRTAGIGRLGFFEAEFHAASVVERA